MPFPSTGCSICRSRHIKCDGTRPTCNQCLKSGRQCPGFEIEQGNLLFKNENIYASSQVRRPRGGARTLALVPQSSSPSSTSSPQDESISSHSSLQISPHLNIALEDQAFSNFVNDYGGPKDPLMDVIITCKGHWQPYSNSALQSAVNAVSLAKFGQRYKYSTAISKSRLTYSRALKETRNLVNDPKFVVQDDVLATVMLLAVYEYTMNNFNETTLYSGAFRHHDGAVALLKVRKEQGRVDRSSLLFQRYIRRQVLNSCMYRAADIPPWLRSGNDYAEEGFELALDICLIKVIDLRINAVRLLSKLKTIKNDEKPNFMMDLQKLRETALEVDKCLIEWADELPLEWRYKIQVDTHTLLQGDDISDSLYFSGMTHKYSNLSHAHVWNRYRAARLVCTHLTAKLLRYAQSTAVKWSSEPESRAEKRIRETETTIQVLVDDLCATIPFHYGLTSSNAQEKEQREAIDKALTYQVYPLVYPLTIALAAKEIPEHQRQWLRHQMKLLARVTGHNVLQKVASTNLESHASIHKIST